MDYSSSGTILSDVRTPSTPTPATKAASAVESAVSATSSAASAAASKIKEGWNDGMQSARVLKQKAAENLSQAAGTVDRFVDSRPKTVALGTLAAGLALGFLAGMLVERARD